MSSPWLHPHSSPNHTDGCRWTGKSTSKITVRSAKKTGEALKHGTQNQSATGLDLKMFSHTPFLSKDVAMGTGLSASSFPRALAPLPLPWPSKPGDTVALRGQWGQGKGGVRGPERRVYGSSEFACHKDDRRERGWTQQGVFIIITVAMYGCGPASSPICVKPKRLYMVLVTEWNVWSLLFVENVETKKGGGSLWGQPSKNPILILPHRQGQTTTLICTAQPSNTPQLSVSNLKEEGDI